MSARAVAARIAARPGAAALAASVLVLSIYALLRGQADWHKVYVDGARAFWAGADPYAAGLGFVYPPGALLLGLPLVAAPAGIARLAYVAINAAALFALWIHAWRLSGGTPGDGWSRRDTVVAAAGCLVGARFVTDVLEHQQTDIVVVALVAAAGGLAWRERWTAAGLCCGIAAAIKATPLIVLGYFVLRRRWGAAAAMVAALLAASLLPDLIAPAPGGRPWLAHWLDGIVRAPLLGDALGHWFTVPVLNQSLPGTLFRLVMLQWPATVADHFGVGIAAVPPPVAPGQFAALARAAQVAVVALGFAAIAWQHWGGRRALAGTAPAPGFDTAILLLMMVLASPASSKPHFLATLPAALCLAREAIVAHDRRAFASVAAAALLMTFSNRSLVGRTIGEPMQWAGAITWAAVILLAGCAAVMVRRGGGRREA